MSSSLPTLAGFIRRIHPSPSLPTVGGWQTVFLQSIRGSCATLIAALQSGAKAQSVGNGAITRVAPVGLTDLEAAAEVAASVAAISHPHPEAQQATALGPTSTEDSGRPQPPILLQAQPHRAPTFPSHPVLSARSPAESRRMSAIGCPNT